MKVIENWKQVALRSYSMWCGYLAGACLAVAKAAQDFHTYIQTTPHGTMPGNLADQLDGYALSVAFWAGLLVIAFGALAMVTRFVHQPNVALPPK